jgi:hypothetical protein
MLLGFFGLRARVLPFFHGARTRCRDRRQSPICQKSRRTIDFRLMFPYYGSGAQMAAILDWIQPLPERGSPQCGPYSSALVLSGSGHRSPSLCNQVAQRRPTESKSVKCWCTKGSRPTRRKGQVHAAPSGQTE